MPVTFNNVTINRVGLHGGRDKLLDKFPGAAAAYSLRSLNSFYRGPVVQVRESANNAEADFTAIEVADGTLAAWVGAGNDGFVKTWYDQSGNGNNANQATLASQPKIVVSGAVIQANGKPTIDYDGSDDYLLTPIVPTGTLSTFSLFEGNSASNNSAAFGGRDSNASSYAFLYNSTNTWRFRLYNNNTFVTTTLPNDVVFSVFNDSSTLQWYAGGTQRLSEAVINPLVNTTQGIALMAWNNAGSIISPYAGYMQEWIIYTSDQLANRTGIESNIATHYGITLS